MRVTADQRFALYLDDRLLTRGPERGDLEHWMYRTLDVELPAAGVYRWVAVVWSPGLEDHRSPAAQLTAGPGFLLAADEPWAGRLDTGRGPWEVLPIAGHRFLPPHKPAEGFLAGGGEEIDGRASRWGPRLHDDAGWRPAVADEAGRPAALRPWGGTGPRPTLRPAQLPEMMRAPLAMGRVRFATSVPSTDSEPRQAAGDEAARPVDPARHDPGLCDLWQALLDGEAAVAVPARRVCRVLIDLQDYACFYPAIRVGGGRGGCILATYAEAMFQPPADRRLKHHRDTIEGLVCSGRTDRFLPDGDRPSTFAPLWWRCGRYVQLVIATADEPLTVLALRAEETRYPLRIEADFACSEPRWEPAARLMRRALEACSHETYMDCPFYEQLQYIGDARLEALVTYVMSDDDRLPRKAIESFEWSRDHLGMCRARHPARGATYIPTFALHWVSMVHDFACWRGDRAFVAARLPAVRGTLEAFREGIGRDGLIMPLPGWQYVDAAPGWDTGVPPGAALQPNTILNWQAVATLRQAAALEAWCGDPLLAERDRRDADALAAAIRRVFWDPRRQLYSDDASHQHFSEHAQVMAVLAADACASGADPPGLPTPASLMERLAVDRSLARCSIYFCHFLFEACRITGRPDLLAQRLEDWYALPGRGFLTTPENADPTRSDCHGWGSHPLFHSRATWLGIRPAGPGFERVIIEPQPGAMEYARGEVPHRLGLIEVEARCRQPAAPRPGPGSGGEGLAGSVRLPAGLTGLLRVNGSTAPLHAGWQRFTASPNGLEIFTA